jgi:hypothetical protein
LQRSGIENAYNAPVLDLTVEALSVSVPEVLAKHLCP